MRKVRGLTAGRKVRPVFRAADLVRPGGEAILLMGVAFGCVQLGWGSIFPDVLDIAPSAASDEGQQGQSRPFQSPFAPLQAASADVAQSAALAGVRVVGVRQSDIAENSGAILAFPDGRQRPFLVGHEISEGLVLTLVEPGRVVVSFRGGEQVIPVDGAAATGSFALLLMGRSAQNPLGDASAMPSLAAEAPSVPAAAAVQVVSASDGQWLAATMAHVEMRNGQPYAWRVAASPPKVVTDAGIEPGDLILTVNGNPPGAPAAMLAAASSREIRIAVERPSGERKVVTLANGLPS